jgi:hypothetical protein
VGSAALHRVIEGSEFVASPWTREEWMFRYVGRSQGSVLDLHPRLVPAIIDFIDRTEATPTLEASVPGLLSQPATGVDSE